MRRLIKFLQSYFLHSWTLSPPFYINQRKKKKPVCYPASYLFRLVINVQEKRTSSLYKIIMHNYIHNSSLWQIPSPRPVVLHVWSGFIRIPLILMTQLAEKTAARKSSKKGQIQQGKRKLQWEEMASGPRCIIKPRSSPEIPSSFLLSVNCIWSRRECFETPTISFIW